MKKIVALILCVILTAACFTACGDKKKDGFTVGICNFVDDASLNQICDNIKAQLEKIAKDNNITITVKYDNCNADANVMNQIISNFIADKVDVMIGVATPVAMAMQAATEDNGIPVVFAAVSDPLGANLVDSLEKPGHNITGTSDALDTEAVLKLITAAKPDIKKVGLLYDQGQDASTAAIKAAKEYLTGKGITVVERTGTNNDEVILAANALVADGVEAVFTPTDNTIMTSELAIYEIFANAKIPQYCGADSFALNGAFLGYGVNYANLGVETANMVKEILVDGKKPETLAVKTFDNGTATINTETCEKIGFVYDDIVKAFTPFCSKIQSIKTADKFE
ncbi:MAG: ABC transporter substrate-binding protein [Lachnospiraceae bacterium]|nr:ABC transporter substrate-binding protein [Lachnospiraceae bacterium]